MRALPKSESLPPEIRTDGTKEPHYVATWYGGSIEHKSATPIIVKAGTDSEIEIQLASMGPTHVGGVVVGAPAGARGLVLRVRDGMDSRIVGNPSADGSFQIWGTDPGQIRLDALCDLNGVHMQTNSVDFDGRSNLENILLRFMGSAELSGTIEYSVEQGQPVQTPETKASLSSLLFREIGLGLAIVWGQPTPLRDDGTFHLDHVPPDPIRVIALGDGYYVSALRVGSVTVDGDILDLSNGWNGEPITVILSKTTGRLSGRVAAGDVPAPGALVAAMRKTLDRREQPHLVFSDQDGKYQINGLAPGEYQIAVLNPPDPAAEEGNFEDYQDVVVTVEITGGKDTALDIKSQLTSP